MAEKKSASKKSTTKKEGKPAVGKTETVKAEAAKVTPEKEADSEKKKWSTKKKVIFWSCLGGGVVIIAVALIILIINLTKVDYAEAYGLADDLKSEMSSLTSGSCSKMVSYASSSSTSEKEYNKYVDKCKEAADGTEELVTKLENSSAVQRDEKIKKDFDKFKKEYDEVIGNSEKKDKALELYKVWHKWILAYNDLSDTDQTDADLEAAAKILTESGNEELKEYGETWLNYRKEMAKTYRAYQEISYGADNYSEIYSAYSKARSAYSSWYYRNSIKIADVTEWKVSSSSDLYTAFSNLYDTIETAYESGQSGSGNPFGIEGGSSSDSTDYSDILKMLGQ